MERLNNLCGYTFVVFCSDCKEMVVLVDRVGKILSGYSSNTSPDCYQ
jgi:hypothetical protein